MPSICQNSALLKPKLCRQFKNTSTFLISCPHAGKDCVHIVVYCPLKKKTVLSRGKAY